MKILKVFGVVVGIHLFALVLIFANPGCTATSKPTPAPIDTVSTRPEAPPAGIIVPSERTPSPSPLPVFDPNAPAVAAVAAASPSGSGFRPTRPNTPAASSLVTAPVSDVTPATTYAVKPGDSLWTIGKKNGLSPTEIAAANNMKVTATLHEGQKLVIPNKAAAPAPATTTAKAGGGTVGNGRNSGSGTAAAAGTPAATAASSATAATPPRESHKHMVQPGEALSTIAKIYGVSQRDLMLANNITNPARIDAGKELIIPGARAAAPKAEAAPAVESAPRPVFNIMDPAPAAAPSGPSPFPSVGGSNSNSSASPFPKSN